MALKATIFKAELQIADMDRHYYGSHSLTIAQHPSETDERMMVRVLAFALYADERLAFTKGISTDDEPDLWLKSLSDEIELWIELGQPDEKRLRKAAGRARQVVIITYNSRSAAVWRNQMQEALAKLDNVTVRALSNDTVESLGKLAQKTMNLQCTIQDGEVSLGDDAQLVQVQFETL
ncbi:MAG TPA: YaeQ family protein [Permianibacter sp.]|nr:YaeQ family protein [Permianibacter sp.]